MSSVKCILTGLLLSILSCWAALADRIAIPANSKQVLLVQTDDWSSTTGTMSVFGWHGVVWKKQVPSFPVTVGKSGLGWGRGLHSVRKSSDPVKKEGDGRAPAGVFTLDFAFGKQESDNPHFPFFVTTDQDRWVDDPRSKYYNRWVSLAKVSKQWSSAETLRRSDSLYDLAIVVGHNTKKTVPGAGSAIFIHLWRGPGMPTIGCTAMSREKMTYLVNKLHKKSNPVLVQLPRSEIAKLPKTNRIRLMADQ